MQIFRFSLVFTLIFSLSANLSAEGYMELSDVNGRAITAKVLSFEAEGVSIERKDGQKFTIPLEQFDQTSRALLKSKADALERLANTVMLLIEPFRIRQVNRGNSQSAIKFSLKVGRDTVWEELVAGDGACSLEVPDTAFEGIDLKEARILLYVDSEGYASQWKSLEYGGSRLKFRFNEDKRIDLYKKRYAIIEYAFYEGDERRFLGRQPSAEGIAAVAHWGSLPFFGQDWQIWQGGEGALGTELFGDVLILSYHRYSMGYGMTDPVSGSYERYTEAPEDGYAPAAPGNQKRKAEKGKVYFCRVEGNSQGCLGFGKFQIKDIVTEVPAGMTILD